MTISDVRLSWSRSGSSIESQDGRTYKGTLTAGYQVTHSADATESELLSASGLPRLRQFYPGTFLRCVRLNQPARLSPIYSIVTADFEGDIGPGDGGGDLADSPINMTPKIKWSDTTSTEAIDEDRDGNAIVTENGEPVEGVTIELPDPVLVVTRNYAFYNPHITHQYRRSVNSDTFASFPPGTARLIAAEADFVESSGLSYWTVTARIQFRYPYNTTAEKAWYARVRHEGFLIDDGSGNITHALDDDGNRVVKPVLLKSDGTRETNAANAYWLEFPRYYALPYSALGLL